MTTPIEQALCTSDPNDPCCPGSPIIIDLGGDGFDLTDLAGGVRFNLNPSGDSEQVSWTASESDDAWLALDRNGNGIIDDGTELFGNFTPQPQSDRPHGYLALAALDLNHDGVIDTKDPVFKDLRLWRDRNHDGVSDLDELSTLEARGILGLSVTFTGIRQTDKYGNLFRYSANVYTLPGSRVGPLSYDVFLITQRLDERARQQGAVQSNGAVSMAAVAPDPFCSGDGGGGDDCYYVTPAPYSCQGGAALCLICDHRPGDPPGTFKRCSRSCLGYKGYNNGMECKICPSSTPVCDPGPSPTICDSNVG